MRFFQHLQLNQVILCILGALGTIMQILGEATAEGTSLESTDEDGECCEPPYSYFDCTG